MKSKKILGLFLTVVLISSLIVGCGSETTKNTEKQETKKVENVKQVNITLGGWSTSPQETELVDGRIKACEEKNSNIKIERQIFTGDYNQQLQVKIASNTQPDIFYLDASYAQMFIEKDAVAPLDDYLSKKTINDFQKNIIEGFQIDGKTYGLPKDYNTLVLYYNKTMFKDANVKVPTTWEELEETAKKLTNDNMRGIVLREDFPRFMPFILQAGGQILDGEKPVFNSKETVEAYDYYFSLIKKGYAGTPKDLGVSGNEQAFTDKKVAMCISGGWAIPFIEETAPDIELGIAKLPKGKQEGDVIYTVAYVMSNGSEHKEDAAKVIEFLTSTEAQKMTVDSGLAMPTRISLSDYFIEKFPNRAAFPEMVKHSQVFQFGANGRKVIDIMTKAGEKVRLGGMSSEDALKEAEEEFNK